MSGPLCNVQKSKLIMSYLWRWMDVVVLLTKYVQSSCTQWFGAWSVKTRGTVFSTENHCTIEVTRTVKFGVRRKQTCTLAAYKTYCGFWRPIHEPEFMWRRSAFVMSTTQLIQSTSSSISMASVSIQLSFAMIPFCISLSLSKENSTCIRDHFSLAELSALWDCFWANSVCDFFSHKSCNLR